MCNLYSNISSPDFMRSAFKVAHKSRRLGNFPPQYSIYPDSRAAVIRRADDGEREMLTMRWGHPHAAPKPGEKLRAGYVTNIRNLESGHWRPWFNNRCLVPATAFSEYTDSLLEVCNSFARDMSRTPFAFAGIWRPWSGKRGTKAEPAEGDHLLFSFLTTDANDIVKPIHQKAMPVILTEDNWDRWLDDLSPVALTEMQQPAPNELMQIVHAGEKRDPPTSTQTMG